MPIEAEILLPCRLQVALVGRLDRERKDRYSLTVRALDGGKPPRSGSLALDIIVTDVNDNNPEFANLSYSVRQGCSVLFRILHLRGVKESRRVLIEICT